MGAIPTCRILNEEVKNEGVVTINQNDWPNWKDKGYELVEVTEEELANPTEAGGTDGGPASENGVDWDKYSDDDIKAFASDSEMDPTLPRVALVAMLAEIKYDPEATE